MDFIDADDWNSGSSSRVTVTKTVTNGLLKSATRSSLVNPYRLPQASKNCCKTGWMKAKPVQMNRDFGQWQSCRRPVTGCPSVVLMSPFLSLDVIIFVKLSFESNFLSAGLSRAQEDFASPAVLFKSPSRYRWSWRAARVQL